MGVTKNDVIKPAVQAAINRVGVDGRTDQFARKYSRVNEFVAKATALITADKSQVTISAKNG